MTEDGTGRGCPIVTHSLRADGFEDGTGRGTPLVATIGLGSDPLWADDCAQPVTNRNGDPGVVAYAFCENIRGELTTNDTAGSLQTGGGKPGQGYPAVAFTLHGSSKTVSTATETQTHCSLRARTPGKIENSSTTAVLQTSAVRRLTPRECERLQGFRDDWTLIPYRGKPAADGPRYRALGNAFAVPVVRWIARRLVLEDAAEASAAELAA